MAQRRFHYEVAFEQYLRQRGIPYIAVDEAKRALKGSHPPTPLKSFDFVVYAEHGPNLLIDVKGRKHTGRSNKSLDNWVTQADVDGMGQWQSIFGEGFQAAFVFLYWCQQQPPNALFQEIFTCGDRWYAVLAVGMEDYRHHMRQRSPRWQTVSIPARQFNRLTVPFRDMTEGIASVNAHDEPLLFSQAAG